MPTIAVWQLRSEARYRAMLSLTLLVGVLALGLLVVFFVASFAWPSDAVATPVEHVTVGNINDYKIEEPVFFNEDKYWLVRLSETDVIALYSKDPHLGCTVPWRPNFSLINQSTGESRKGWFRNPCHGETYDIQGLCVGGPCVRNLDRRPVTLTANGRIIVNIADNRLIKGGTPLREPWFISSSEPISPVVPQPTR